MALGHVKICKYIYNIINHKHCGFCRTRELSWSTWKSVSGVKGLETVLLNFEDLGPRELCLDSYRHFSVLGHDLHNMVSWYVVVQLFHAFWCAAWGEHAECYFSWTTFAAGCVRFDTFRRSQNFAAVGWLGNTWQTFLPVILTMLQMQASGLGVSSKFILTWLEQL